MSSRKALRHARRTILAAAVALLAFGGAHAQPGATPGAGAPPRSPRESAPIDLTGTWASIVNEDWRWRMVTPPKGDTTSIGMLNAAGKAAAAAWEPSQDGSCKAYGAAALLRMPTRLKIAWRSDTVLELQTDAGRQTRLFRFAGVADAPPAARPPSLQGDSTAAWQRALRRVGSIGPPPPGPPPVGGTLKVTTTNLAGGWLRRNGVPYSERATLTEYFDRFKAPDGAEWLVVTTVVEDPVYLSSRFVTSSHFRREADDSKWRPQGCRED